MDSRSLPLFIESKEDKLPDPLVPIYGFLEPYKVIRNGNGITSIYKADVCDEIINKIKKAHQEQSYDQWEEILNKLDYHIENERKVIPAGIGLFSPLESIYYLSKKFAKYAKIIDEKHAFLIALLNTRTYICMELQAHNQKWQKSIKEEYNLTQELHEKILKAKIQTPSQISDEEIQKWERDRNASLEVLAKKYHVPSIVFAMTSCQLFLQEKEILPIARSNRHIPEHYQPDFYARGFEYSIPAFKGKNLKTNATLKQFVEFIHSTCRLDGDELVATPTASASGSVQNIQNRLGINTAFDAEAKRSATTHSVAVEKPARQLPDEDIQLLLTSASQELVKIRDLLQSEKDKNSIPAKSIYDPTVLATLPEEEWQKLVKITRILKTQQKASLSKSDPTGSAVSVTPKPG
ncbi:MAG: hypothetical protein ACYCQI_00640 [Gammaproteobacteria bacterium]